jgi:hypothetical protein
MCEVEGREERASSACRRAVSCERVRVGLVVVVENGAVVH